MKCCMLNFDQRFDRHITNTNNSNCCRYRPNVRPKSNTTPKYNLNCAEVESLIKKHGVEAVIKTEPTCCFSLDTRFKNCLTCSQENCSFSNSTIYDNISQDVANWMTNDFVKWFISLCVQKDINYEEIDFHAFRGLNGESLLHISKDECERLETRYGQWIFEELQHLKVYNTAMRERRENKNKSTSIFIAPVNKSTNKRKRIKLPYFIMKLLHSPRYCPRIIRWKDYENGKFKFVQQKEIEALWNSMRTVKKVKFDNFCRALRFYYKKGVFRTDDEDFVYTFGENCIGWKHPFPNFTPNINNKHI